MASDIDVPSPASAGPVGCIATEPGLVAGDPAPLFTAATVDGRRFKLATAAGRYLVLSFIDSGQHGPGADLLAGIRAEAAVFQRRDFNFLAISRDDADRADHASLPTGLDMAWDLDGAVAALYRPAMAGALAADRGRQNDRLPMTFILNANLRLLAIFAAPDGTSQAADAIAYLQHLPAPPSARPAQTQAPVLVVPYLFEPALCQRLIAGHQAGETVDSGYVIERNGATELVVDHQRKHRRDWLIDDPALLDLIHKRIATRLMPEIRKAFAAEIDAIERYVVACYDAEAGGYFRAHRDNTTPATRHRRFAVSVNLNAEDYDGGDLSFPEYGAYTYRAPTGGAVVFSCALLHEALPVKRGKRYAFLPFLYQATT